MHRPRFDGSFEGWRSEARRLLQAGIAPHQVDWTPDAGLFDSLDPAPADAPGGTVRIPRELPELLAQAARFRQQDRWGLLYRVLWRAARGDRSAMLPGDRDGAELHRRLKAVRREAHHLHAFLRFRPGQAQRGEPDYLAWIEPAHEVLDLAAEHFVPRMGRYSWLIATPDGVACFNGERLAYLPPGPPGLQAAIEERDDPDQSLWQAYYRSTFNPARLNPKVMRGHMPARFWRHLPEGPLIPALVSAARTGQQRLAQAPAVGAQDGKTVLISPLKAQPVREATSALERCQACPRWHAATCAVAGQGPETADVIVLGSQPSDQDDLSGQPFSDPAGIRLREALANAGLARERLYFTHAVKHFAWHSQGLRSEREALPVTEAELTACAPWLEAELQQVRPRLVIALGDGARAALRGFIPQHLAEHGGEALETKQAPFGAWFAIPWPAGNDTLEALARRAAQWLAPLSGSGGPDRLPRLPGTARH